MLPAVERAGFIRKPGGTFQWGTSAEPWSFWFREDPGGYSHAFHVLRSEFDAILLRHAAASGARVEEGCGVERVTGTGPFRVHAKRDDGSKLVAEAAHVVDASGQRTPLTPGLLGYVLAGAQMGFALAPGAATFARGGTIEALVNGNRIEQQVAPAAG